MKMSCKPSKTIDDILYKRRLIRKQNSDLLYDKTMNVILNKYKKDATLNDFDVFSILEKMKVSELLKINKRLDAIIDKNYIYESE